MRFLSTRLLTASLLPAAAGLVLAAGVLAPVVHAEDHGSPLEAADRLEREGRENLERGQKVEGAKKLSEAWRLRAKVWAAEGGEGPPAPEVAALKEKIERLKAESGEAERAGHKLKEAGQVEESNAKMEESGRLWRQAKELSAKLETLTRYAGDRNQDDAFRRDKQVADLMAHAARVREEAKGAEAEAKQADAEGKEEAAKAARARIERLREKAGALERQIAEAKGAGRGDPKPAPGGPADEIRALRGQMEELRRIVDELRKRLEEKSR